MGNFILFFTDNQALTIKLCMQMNLDAKINCVISDRTTVTSVIKLFNACSYLTLSIILYFCIYSLSVSINFFDITYNDVTYENERERKGRTIKI